MIKSNQITDFKTRIYQTATHGFVVFLCRIVVGGIFIFASLDKLSNPAGFAQAIANYKMVPYNLLHIIALFMPMAEFLAGVALLLGLFRRGAALLCAAMSLVFIIALATALIRGLDISCGCFHTDGGHGVGLDLLIRDVFLLLACLPPLVSRNSGLSLSRAFRR